MDIVIPHGVRNDPRPVEEKTKDHTHELRYSGLPVTWIEKSTWKLPSQRFQDGSYSCVMQGAMSGLEVILGKSFSASVYQLRKDADTGVEGMYLQDAGDILYNHGTYLELDVPSQNMNDAQLDSIKLPEQVMVKSTGYRTFINYKDIDSIAQAISAYRQCNMTFESNSEEWKHQILTYNGQPTTFGHNICGVDFGLVNGVKTIACRDGAVSDGLRLVQEDFLSKRATGARYELGAKFIEIPSTPPPVINPPVQVPTINWWSKLMLFINSLIHNR